MAGQRARAPYDEAEVRRQRPVPSARRSGEGAAGRTGGAPPRRPEQTGQVPGRRGQSAFPGPRTSAAGGAGARGGQRDARAANVRRGAGAPAGRLPAVYPAIGLPLFGAAVDAVAGSGVGVVFAVCAVLGAALATLVSSRAGWWWVVTSAPVVVLVVAVGAEYLADGDRYQGKALATGALRWVTHAFPVMAAAVLAALLAVGVRMLREGRGRRG
ncbi:DUF6542 domain-containing protein [Kitasatospora sp. NPDC056138]|uniref:DUF6542 domain-containing protein n=1 Tax=Kitasatospora sp. NPDC056138 TaxID=3345724 RepID=UPI0035E1BD73